MGALAVALITQATGMVILAALVVGRGVPAPPLDLALIGVGTGLLSALNFYAMYTALSIGNMARIAPIFGTAAIIPVVVGLASGESPSSLKLLGILLAIAGVVLVSVDTGEKRSHGRRGPVLALVCAAGFGLVLTGVDRVAEHDPYWAILLMRFGGTVTIGTVVVMKLRGAPGSVPRGAIAPLLAIGALDSTAHVLWAVASTTGLLSLTAVLGNLFPAVTALLSVALLRERLALPQAIGAAGVLAGCALVTAG